MAGELFWEEKGGQCTHWAGVVKLFENQGDVRMTKRQLLEMIMDLNKGDSKLGCLILQECLKSYYVILLS
jgi:hypothetical protein